MDAIDELLADLGNTVKKAPAVRASVNSSLATSTAPKPSTPAAVNASQRASVQPSSPAAQPNSAPASSGGAYAGPQPPKNRDFASASKYAQEIEQYCKSSGKKFEDPEFPANAFALYKNGDGPLIGKVWWRRPNEVTKAPKLFVDGVESGDVIQGALGDCYFLGALSVVATRTDLLQPLFVHASPQHGFYQIKFFKEGAWVVVTIDDRLPVMMANDTPVFGRCRDPNEQWVPLIEKAYAKLHRCYEVIAHGSIDYALTDLTGEFCSLYDFTKPEIQSMVQSGELFKKMMWFIEEDYLMGCSNNTDTPEVEIENGEGILSNHAYGLLKCADVDSTRLMCVRNPWGCREWKGRFSDNDSAWTPSLISKLNVKFEDDGTFWMELSDFTREYNSLIVLRLLNDERGKMWSKYAFDGSWAGRGAGGCPNFPTWQYNPQFLLVAKERTTIFACLQQPDARLDWKDEYECAPGMYVLRTKDSKMKKIKCPPSEVVCVSAFAPNREATIEFVLEAGEMVVVVPSTFKPNQLSKFYLRIWSENPLASCQQLAEMEESVTVSEWRGASAGGCVKFPSYENNPTFVINAQSPQSTPTKLVLVLRQEERTPLYYVGMNIGKYTSGKPDRYAIQFKNNPTNARESILEVDVLPEMWPLWVVPFTFEANQQGRFELIAKSFTKINVCPLSASGGLLTPVVSSVPAVGNVVVSTSTPMPATSVVASNAFGGGAAKWSVDRVCDWLKSLQLSQDYSALLKQNNVDGAVVVEMKTRDDWKELGIQSFGDLTKLAKASGELKP